MAFNFQVFKTRALTAVIFVAVMLTGLLYNPWSFFVLFSIIHFGCWIEYQKIIGLIYPPYKNISSAHRNIVMLLGWCFMMFCAGNIHNLFLIGRLSLRGIGWYAMMLLTIIFCLNEVLLKKHLDLKVLGYSVLGLLYISLSWGLMIRLYDMSIDMFHSIMGFMLPIILIATIWLNDTMAYLVGSFIGKTPLSPISPKKTWEGTLGGVVLAVLIVSLGFKPLLDTPGITILILVSTTAAIAGTFGDLLESKLKRMAGIKDSGQIMPGHGGFLDRFDSLVLSTPVVWLVAMIYLYINNQSIPK